jgi:hypothetical protein
MAVPRGPCSGLHERGRHDPLRDLPRRGASYACACSGSSGRRQNTQASATVTTASASPNSPTSQAVVPASPVIGSKNCCTQALWAAWSSAAGQRLPERSRSQAAITESAPAMTVKFASPYQSGPSPR